MLSKYSVTCALSTSHFMSTLLGYALFWVEDRRYAQLPCDLDSDRKGLPVVKK